MDEVAKECRSQLELLLICEEIRILFFVEAVLIRSMGDDGKLLLMFLTMMLEKRGINRC